MKRRKFIKIAGGTVILAGGATYLLSDKSNVTRSDTRAENTIKLPLRSDEINILYLASLAPSGHNTQPWAVKYIAPYHWVICNDKTKWLPKVDPTQRETILSIGAFMQNLEYAANNSGYDCLFEILAMTNQDENLVEVKLVKSGSSLTFNTDKIKTRRTVRSNYLNDPLKKEDLSYLVNDEKDFFHFFGNTTKEFGWLNEQTIEANKIQAYRDEAQKELSEWIRFSSKDAEKYRDGLTTASMEIMGMPGWILRNFYRESNVMAKGFREQGIDKVKSQVSRSAGWLLMTSKDNSLPALLETGMRMQRMFLKVRERGIAIHPMTQILEESQTAKSINRSIGISDRIQFIIRTGYLNRYPVPVSLRRPVERFVKV
ncbi:MAG: hypothetical protein WBN18_12510 [Flavobacteriaceae bacterium]